MKNNISTKTLAILFVLAFNVFLSLSWLIRYEQISFDLILGFVFSLTTSFILFFLYFKKLLNFDGNLFYLAWSELFLSRNLKDLKRSLSLFKNVISEKEK